MDEIIPFEEYKELSEKAKKYLFTNLLNIKNGLVTAAPLICSTDCPFIKRCPINLADGKKSLPIGLQCLVEINFIKNKYDEYLTEFEEITITEKALVSKLIELDLLDYRANLIIAGIAGDSDGTLLIDQTISISDEGDPIVQKQEHPIFKIKEKIHKQRMEILDTLVLTPKKKIWKQGFLKQKNDENYISQGRRVQELLENLVDKLT